MKYILILAANCLFILYGIMFFIDHKFIPEGTGAKIKNLLLLSATLWVSYNVLFIYILKKEDEQSGLIYKIASGSKHVVLSAQTFIQPFQHDLFTSIITAGVIMGISILILGMPGGLIVEVVQNILPVKKIEGDDMWPAALYVSFFWPLCFPIAVLTKNYFIQHGYTGYEIAGVSISGTLWVTTIISSAFFLFAKSPRF
jgi:hypothetical protein